MDRDADVTGAELLTPDSLAWLNRYVTPVGYALPDEGATQKQVRP